MKKLLMTLVPTFLMAVTVAPVMVAQGYYDDDIYFDANKAKKEQQAKALKKATETARRNYVPSAPVANYPAADTYVVNSGSTRDVDEYNRRYTNVSGKEVTDSISLDQLTRGDFANTRNIERFSNPDIISGSNDADLQDYYYAAQEAPSTTIININTVDPWYYGWNSPWYGYSPYYSPYSWRYNWAWNWGYDPWYGPSWAWGPSWSWGWGGGWAGPSWGWGGPSWGWGGGWHGPGWGGPSWGHVDTWRPASPGATRPHNPGGVVTTTPGRRPGNSSYSTGNSYYGGNNSVSGSRLNGTAGRRGTTSSAGVSTGSSAGSRPQSAVSNSSSNSGRGNSSISGSRVNRSSSSSSSSSSYNNSGWGSRNSSSSSSWSTGSSAGSRSSGGSFGGGSRSSGGGGRGRH